MEGLGIAIIVACIGGWLILKVVYWYDERDAQRIRSAREKRNLAQYGRIKTHEEIMEEARANVWPED